MPYHFCNFFALTVVNVVRCVAVVVEEVLDGGLGAHRTALRNHWQARKKDNAVATEDADIFIHI